MKNQNFSWQHIFSFLFPHYLNLVLILEQKEPLIHIIHSMLCENLKIFFPGYVKFELLTSSNLKDLKSIDARNNVWKLKTLYVGDKAEKLAK